MYSSPKQDDYRTQESYFSMFFHSCFGRLLLAGLVLLFVILMAAITCPSEKHMHEQLTDDIRQCIEKNDSVYHDKIDEALSNIGYFFSEADPNVNMELKNKFSKYNRLEYYDHGLYSTMYVFNNLHSEGVRVGVGLFGMVIPTLSSYDFLLDVSTLRKDYNERVIENKALSDSLYFGETPDLIFHDEEYW